MKKSFASLAVCFVQGQELFTASSQVDSLDSKEMIADISSLPEFTESDGSWFNPIIPSVEGDHDKCCTSCEAPLEKYFSIVYLLGNCGESCLDPKHYWLYKILEPGLRKDEHSNTPCADRGYTHYKYSPTHSAGPIHAKLDMYDKPKQEEISEVKFEVEDEGDLESLAKGKHGKQAKYGKKQGKHGKKDGKEGKGGKNGEKNAKHGWE